MRGQAWGWVLPATLLFTLLVPGSALAGYDRGSALVSDAPVTPGGRVEASVSGGVASFVAASTPLPDVAFTFQAGEVYLEHWDLAERCTEPTSLDCFQAPQDEPAEDVVLRDAEVRFVRALEPYKVAVVTDARRSDRGVSFQGASLVVDPGAQASLTGTQSRGYLHAFSPDWTTSEPRNARAEPVYDVPAAVGRVTASGGTVRAGGNFEVFLQGLLVSVTGTTAKGEAFARSFSLSRADDGASYLVLEAKEGAFSATSSASLNAFRVDVVDVVTGSVSFPRVEGALVSNGVRQEYGGVPLTLSAPISLALGEVTTGDPVRLSLAVSSTLRVAQEADVPALDPGERADPVDLAAAGAAGAGVAALAAAAAFFWPRIKFATTLLFLPLFTRISRSEVLDHEKRDEIYELIRKSPGIHAHEIGARAQIGWGTTVYHLKMLESHSLVVSKKAGRYKRFFVNTGEYTRKKDVYGALRNDTAKAVADHVLHHPGTTQKELCQALGIQPSLASWHVEKLEGVGLVKRVKDGRQVRYFAGPAWSDLNVRLTPAGPEGVAET